MLPAIFSMLNQKNLSLILLSATLFSLMFVAAVNSNFTFAQNEKFKAKLKGESEVPPVNSSATGKAKFKVKGDVITTNVNVTGLKDITAAQIYAGAKGQNGEPVLDLLKTGKQNNAGEKSLLRGKLLLRIFKVLCLERHSKTSKQQWVMRRHTSIYRQAIIPTER